MSTTEQDELPVTADETDSTLGEETLSDDTTIGSSLEQYPEENGRKYHAYKDGKYLFPNDEHERHRLDHQHELSLEILEGDLYVSPVDSPSEILDVGTGTGNWAIEAADRHPQARVLGVDLSPIQPTLVPPNCHFQVWDFEEPWGFERQFDLIHGRLLIGSVSDPRELLRQAYESLAPGGWLEIQDVCPPKSDDDSIPPDGPYRRWIGTWCQALRAGGRDPFLAARYADLFREAGFADVRVERFRVPQNNWPADPDYKTLGTLNCINILAGIEGLTLRPLTKFLGWTLQEVQVLVARARPDVKDTRIHAYWPV
ncbi:hypothetical protein H2204_001251 [Knufia peltigerae]|uniref:Methyltransferase n=1 Tax=Knufia peltigerae TaxID=1002370 RepID=A0AA39D1D8_9EURO|nr:hypothetical protein H2204_001251 [Knufia peltigerae]